MTRPTALARCLALALLFASTVLAAEKRAANPVTPGASPEARALLQFLYDISGRHMLTGQHNFPKARDRNTQFAARHIGKTPAVFSTDFGFADASSFDSYLARPDIVKEAIRQHQLGSIVTICWHAVPPTADEPVTFRGAPGTDPKALKSVLGKLPDELFKELLTPGTALYNRWAAQVDTIAGYLKQLQDAKIPVLWRPYHEMNGDWFWWGGRPGDQGSRQLYRQIYDRLTNHHQLKNLIWVWSLDRGMRPGMEYERYFPGTECVDVLGLDVYGGDFAQPYYESLEKLSQGKPLALSEVGVPPAPEVLDRQPKWTFYVTWSGMVRNTPRKTYATLMKDPRVLNLEGSAYAEAMTPFREACGLPALRFEPKPANFSGRWVIDEEASSFDTMGPGFAPARLEVTQDGNNMTIRTVRIVEHDDDQIAEESLTLDGRECSSEFMDSPRVTTARFTRGGEELVIESTIMPNWGGVRSFKATIKDSWQLLDGGRQLSVRRSADTPRGKQEMTLIFDRS